MQGAIPLGACRDHEGSKLEVRGSGAVSRRRAVSVPHAARPVLVLAHFAGVLSGVLSRVVWCAQAATVGRGVVVRMQSVPGGVAVDGQGGGAGVRRVKETSSQPMLVLEMFSGRFVHGACCNRSIGVVASSHEASLGPRT